MKPAAYSALILAASFSAPAFAQDAPPPFEEGTDADYGESPAVELGEDIYSEDDDYDDVADETPPTYEEFHRELSPHGSWVNTAEYGTVWVPAGRRSWWRPYTHGEWIYTRHGWTFVSHDPWGAIPFHYGRWVFRSSLGWCWVPGYEWSPAWVSWRYGGSYVAWAPLGPVGVSVGYYSAPSLWIAVRGDHFRRPLHHRHFIRTRHLGVVFKSTREYRSHRHGPTVEYVRRVTRTPVRRAKVVSHARPYHYRGNRNRAVQVTRPNVQKRHIERRHPEKRHIEKRRPDQRYQRQSAAVVRQPPKRSVVKQAPPKRSVVKQAPPSRVVEKREVRVEQKGRPAKGKRERREHRH